jgi:hypothetical protein
MLEINDGYWKLDGKDMPIVTQSAHIGIQKSETKYRRDYLLLMQHHPHR